MINQETIHNAPIEEIKPYPKNYLNHDKNIQHIINSIRDFGYLKCSILVDENNILLAGHGTLKALKQLDYKTVPYIAKVSGLSDQQKEAYRIADNSTAKAAKIIDYNLSDIIENTNLFKLDDYGFDYDFLKEQPEYEESFTPNENPFCQTVTFILSNTQKDILDIALDKAKKKEDCKDELNQNEKGNILAAILRKYING
jgi:hypothetical protein